MSREDQAAEQEVCMPCNFMYIRIPCLFLVTWWAKKKKKKPAPTAADDAEAPKGDGGRSQPRSVINTP